MRTVLAVTNADLQLALEMVLRDEPGFTVIGSVGSAEALRAIVPVTRPALVVMDGELGVRPGEVRALSPRRTLLVAVLTGSDVPEPKDADVVARRDENPRLLLTGLRALRGRTGNAPRR